MKNREFKTLIAAVMLMAMAAGSVGTASKSVQAAKNQTVTVQSTVQEKDTATTDSASGAKPFKEETVYAKIDENGSVKSVTVSDQLKNISGETEVKDASELKDIVNVKGDETFSETGNHLVWNTNHADICYQGTTGKELPVGIKITYRLDGKEISSEDLDGKSGHLVIRYTYENKTGNAGEDQVPFLMITGLVMDSSKFTNITVSNGKLISDGEREVALGFGLPAMKEMLGIEDLEIPDYFEVEADVTEYEAVQGITVATNGIFNELDTEQLDSLDDLENSMKELQEAANQLVSGSGQLKDGLDTLLSSSGTLLDGVQRLAAGSKTLQSGTKALASGLATASAKVTEDLLPGVKQLDAGVDSAKAQVELLNAGVDQAASAATGLNQGIDRLSENLITIQNTAADISTRATALAGSVQEEAISRSAAITASVTALQSLADSMEDGTQKEAVLAVIQDLNGANTGLSDVSQQTAILSAEAQGVAAGIGTANGMLQFANGQTTLKDAATVLEAALYPGNGSVMTIKDGVTAMQDALTYTGTGVTLKDGTSQLVAGIDGPSGLASGLNQLSGGAQELVSGNTELTDGIGTLQTGSVALIDGVKQLEEGAVELNDGMIRFNEDGIKKLVSVFDGDIEGLLDKVNGMLDASRSYKNFSGIVDDMEGEVKFIFITDK